MAEPAVLALGEAAVRDDTVGHTGRDGGGRVCDRTGGSAAASAPDHVRKTQLFGTEGSGEPSRRVAVVAVRGEPVDVAWIDAGVFARSNHGFEAKHKLGVGGLAGLEVRRLTNADDRGVAPQGAPHRLGKVVGRRR